MKVCRSTKGHSDNHYITSKPFFCLVHLQTISDSDDDDLSDSELDDLMYLMSGTVESDDDDDVQEVNIGEWNMVLNYKTILKLMPPSVKMGTILVANYPQMPLSVKNGDITGSTLSANAAVCKKRDNTGSELSANAAVCKDRVNAGSKLSANAAVRKKWGHYW